ncbi:bacteriophage T4 gp5 trimerisation domain-containing protein [Arcobacter vandammei]|uniref:bacteriophage T4 gp5 trimerisation domain-containing protein n=1 Tax=Arcobacter vandammei TaxID=2782243 RepID=UPI0018DF2585|nr:hypothetical protein [Arcobacter vandammei]
MSVKPKIYILKHNQTNLIENDRTEDIKNDETKTINNDKVLNVKANYSQNVENLSREEEIKLFATPIELDLGYEVFGMTPKK